MIDERSVASVLVDYPRIYFACHARHVHDPEMGKTLSAHQASILSHLDSVDPTRLTELAEHMGVTASTMSISVKRLVAGGYVTRARDAADGRVVHLRLTDEGERMRRAQEVLDADRVRAMLGRLTSAELDEALRGLSLLAVAADREVRSWRANKEG